MLGESISSRYLLKEAHPGRCGCFAKDALDAKFNQGAGWPADLLSVELT